MPSKTLHKRERVTIWDDMGLVGITLRAEHIGTDQVRLSYEFVTPGLSGPPRLDGTAGDMENDEGT